MPQSVGEQGALGQTPGALVRVGDEVTKTSREWGREDLADRLAATRARLADPYVRVLVVGEYKQGKSKLINAIVGAPVCPVDDDIATRIPTVVGYGETPSAAVLVRHPSKPDLSRHEVPIDEVGQYVAAEAPRFAGGEVVGAEILVPREILKNGLRLVDSPGVGDAQAFRALSALTALSGAHAMLMVSDASQEYTAPEIRLLSQAVRVSPHVSAVVTKTDAYPQWRQIAGIDERHLESVGQIPVFPVSSDLRLAAAARQDRELNEESGFPELIQHLHREVLHRAGELERRAAAADLHDVVEQLSIAVRSELTALQHPERTPEIIERLEYAKRQAEEFRSRSSRWQTTLTDGVADLIADTEHDLRDRLRRVQRQAEEAIEAGDPGPVWGEFAQWLDERVGEAVADTFVWTNDRQRWLAQEVAGQFLEGEEDIPQLDVGDITGVLDPVDEMAELDAPTLSAGEKIYIGVRGSYGGVLMVGLATSVIGLAVLNPLSLLAGVLVGRRAYREDTQARLTRRQNEAKNLVRRYIDEIAFQVGKQLRDRLRSIQRATRDHFGTRADEIHRSLTAAAEAARKPAATFAQDRDARVAELTKRLQYLTRVKNALPAAVEAPQETPAAVAAAPAQRGTV
ncbi:dynamin family protein [Microbacterium sp. EYE_5]|uniref:dynamin family protein n=1 Tax=unclassified Microbacterium TaxID=2609290 RepID=UPI002003246D|nr:MULTISPECIES: dynamin family protein [unclassified Microbacterium]MCK6079006.1 dynamin family protein [Microbacterium sp. EYE_382]MCK6084276.1 dynamin family protein [Microbacterium sp. EYE_384]MCK6123495.1 dynamin family protein [Microbacterium sp. EYE_80]MCK6125040.1 dynamin family protein [Microbacterium sp. EYE_79]MCK6142870.1 dynamin family protein [Microbacterium sp. EYE_39]